MNTRHCENRDCVNPQWDCRTCWFWMRERKEAAEAEVAILKEQRDRWHAKATQLAGIEDERDRLRAALEHLVDEAYPKYVGVEERSQNLMIALAGARRVLRGKL